MGAVPTLSLWLAVMLGRSFAASDEADRSARSRRLACAGIDKLSLQLKWLVQAQFMGFLAARDMGGPFGNIFRTEECLLVQIRPGDPTLDPIEEVLEGFSDVGLVSASSFIQAVSAGEPVTALGTIFRKNGMALVARRDFCGRSSPPCTLQDLQGKKVGLSRDGVIPVSKLLKDNNISFTAVPKGFGANDVLSMDEYPAASLMIFNELGLAQETLNPYTGYLWQRDEFLVWEDLEPSVDEVIVTRDEVLASKPDALKRFLRGSVKGWIHCRENEEQCVELLPNSNDHQRFMLREMLRMMYPARGTFGHYAADVYWANAQLLLSDGLIGALPATFKVNNSLIDEGVREIEEEGVYPDVHGRSFEKASLGICAPKGTSNYHICQGLEATLCNAGRYPVDHGACGACPVGTHAPDEDRGNECEPCAPGRFSDAAGSTRCTDCKLGRYSDAANSTLCEECPAGRYSNDGPKVLCKACPPGRYLEEPGGTVEESCELCGMSTYSESAGSTACARCSDPHATTLVKAASSELDCGCAAGYTLWGGVCSPCPTGLLCEEGQETPTQAQGFFAVPRNRSRGGATASPALTAEEAAGVFAGVDGPYSVFECHKDARWCPAGPAGACAPGREGIGCSRCAPGKIEAQDGSCQPCMGGDALPLIAACLVVLLFLVFIYHKVDTETRATTSHTMLLAGITCSMAVTCLQQLGVVGIMSVAWEEPLSTLLKAASLLNFDMDVLKLNCMVSLSALERYASMLALVLIGLAAILVVHVGFVLVRHGGRFCSQMPSLFGIVGTVFMIFQISMLNSGLVPYQCQAHPNGLSTVQRFPTVLCQGSDEHLAMQVVGAIFLLVPCAFIASCCWAVWMFPQRVGMSDGRFLRATAFLFFRFKVQKYWYVICFLARNLCLSLTILLPDTVYQILFFAAVMQISSSSISCLFPWRQDPANYMEMLISLLVNMMLIGVACLIPQPQIRWISTICTAFIVAMFAIITVMLLYACAVHVLTRHRKLFKFFICHHKLGSGGFARLLKMELQEVVGTSVLASLFGAGKVFVDSDDLTNVENLFAYVGSQTETLVVLMTQEILLRPWCVGEMVTAHVSGVRVSRVIFPDFEMPSAEWIETYDQHANLDDMLAYGISVQMAQATLRWLPDQPGLSLPADVLKIPLINTTRGLATALCKRSSGGVVSPASGDGPSRSCGVAVVPDASSIDMIASAQVLVKMLISHLAESSALAPRVILERGGLSDDVKFCIFLLSNGCFARPAYAGALLASSALEGAGRMPVVAEDGFRFPDRRAYRELRARYEGDDAELPGGGAPALLAQIGDLLHEIAVVFAPQGASSSEAQLRVKATAIAVRIRPASSSSGGAVRAISSPGSPREKLGGKEGGTEGSSQAPGADSDFDEDRVTEI